MINDDTKTYKPKVENLVFQGTLGTISLFGSVIMFWLIFKLHMEVVLLLLFLFIGLSGLFIAYYLLSFFWKMQLQISGKGILYQEPLLTVYCEWSHIQGIRCSDKVFILLPDKTARPKRNLLKELLITGSQNIYFPIHPFVKNWKNRINWQEEVVLKSIAFHLPGVEIGVVNDENLSVD